MTDADSTRTSGVLSVRERLKGGRGEQRYDQANPFKHVACIHSVGLILRTARALHGDKHKNSRLQP